MPLRAQLRACAAALALLWALVPVAAAVHGALEAHTYCVEHNALEHDGAHGADHDHELAPCDALREEDATVFGTHAACALGEAVFRDAARVSVAPTVVPAPALDAPVVAIASPDTPAARAPLSVAPKTSPPSV